MNISRILCEPSNEGNFASLWFESFTFRVSWGIPVGLNQEKAMTGIMVIPVVYSNPQQASDKMRARPNYTVASIGVINSRDNVNPAQ
jgi:hypothetical protein